MTRSGDAGQASGLIHKLLGKTQHLLSGQATWSAVKAIAGELIEHESISERVARHHLTLAQSAK